MLDLIRSYGPISRVELATRTGLTQATLSGVARALLADGLVAEAGRAQSTGGKPRTNLQLVSGARFAVGVQLGSESNSFVAVDLAGSVVGRMRTVGVSASTPADALRDIGETILALLSGVDVDPSKVVGVGLVAPGPIDVDGGTFLGAPQLKGWKNVPARERLAEAVGIPVILDNDASAAALGDFWSGDLPDVHAHATIYMGQGIGAGLLLNGTVLRGASSNSGELGQTILDTSGGRLCTLQELAAPLAVVQNALTRVYVDERYGLTESDPVGGFRRLAVGAARGDKEAAALLQGSADYLAIAVTNLAAILDLDSVSLAGPAFADAGDIYVHAITDRLRRQFFARDRHAVRVRMSSQVSDAAAVGGAALVLQTLLAPRTFTVGR